MTTETTQSYDWYGRTLIGGDGEKIGTIDELYVDQNTSKPEWARVNTGLFGGGSSFVPLAGASPQGEDVNVHVTKGQVKDAPAVQDHAQITQDEEARLFQHYGVDYTDEGSVTATGTPDAGDQSDETVGRDTSGPTTDNAMTRSEEELAIGKTQRESGRVRLRKYVVTEQVTQTVPVQREEVRVEREPITDANVGNATDGPAISDEEHEVVLHEEEVVVEKRAVPKERVRLDKETVTDEAQVSEEVRKEQIDVAGDGRA